MIGTVLVVDDEVQAREEIRPKGDHALIVMPCRNRDEALRAVDSEPIIGMIIDYRLVEAGVEYSGIDLLGALRQRLPTKPAMIVTASRDPSIAAQAVALGARYANKLLDAFYGRRIEDFFNFVISEAMDVIPELRAAVYKTAQQWELHPHETVVVAAYNHEHTREEVARWLRLPDETLKSRVANVLRKSRLTSMARVHHEVLAIARRIRSSSPG